MRRLVFSVVLFMGATARADDLVTVDVFGDGGGTLQHAEANTSEWKDVCVTPCRKEVPRSGRYRVESSAYASKPIVLHGDDITLYAKVGHPESTGLIVGVLGVVVAGAGIATLDAALFTAFLCTVPGSNCSGTWIGTAAIVGGVMLGVGAVLTIVGFVSHRNVRATSLHQVDLSFPESKRERSAIPQIATEYIPIVRVTF